MKRALIGAVVVMIVLVAPALAGSRGPGDLDRSFGDGGLLVVNRAHDDANAIDIGRKGRIVVAGLHTIARRRPNGHPDRSFGNRGITRLESGPYAGPGSFVAFGPSSVAVGPNGAVFVAGATCSDTCDFAVSRLTPDGELDQSFGQGGTAHIGFGSPFNEALSIAITTGGRLVVGGRTCDADCDLALARLNRHGGLDPSFGSSGKVTGSLGSSCEVGFGGIALDSRDRIVGGGSCQNGIASLARFKPNGEPDHSFGHRGRVTRYVGIRSVDALAVDSHDRIDLAGVNDRTFGVVRFGSGGRFDSSFGHHGIARVDFPRIDYAYPRSVALDSRDRIVVAGYAQARGFAFARFKPNGHVNHRFGHDGTRSVGGGDHFRGANSVAIDRHDRIVAAGRQKRHHRPHFGVVRLLG